MAQFLPELPLEPRIARILETFSVDPGDMDAFTTLEQHFMDTGDWPRLAGVYECRLLSMSHDHPQRAALVLRLADLLEEKLSDVAGARRWYGEALSQGTRDAALLARLRRLHVRANDLGAALQIAELEETIERTPAERAQLLVELAAVWERIGDPDQAMARIREALRLDPECGSALEVLADLSQADGRTDEAARYLERRAARLEGSARGQVLERLADLCAHDGARVLELLRESDRLDPGRTSVIEKLLPLEVADQSWEAVETLYGRFWHQLDDDDTRLGVALRVAELHLEQSGELEAAARWADRAAEIDRASTIVQHMRARIFRRTGQTDGLIEALEGIAASDAPSPDLALELGQIYEQQGDLERAVTWLHLHLEQVPGSAEAFVRLERCLAELQRDDELALVLEQRLAIVERAEDRATLLVRLGDLRLRATDDAGAESAYRQALGEVTGHAGGAAGLLHVLRQQSRGEDLADLLEDLAGSGGSAATQGRLLTQLGSVRLELLGELDGAAEAYRRALDLQADSPDALDGLREIARLRGDPALRVEICERELELGPEPTRAVAALEDGVEAALEAGDPIRALRLAGRWAEIGPGPDSVRALARTSRAAGDRARERVALITLESLLKEDVQAQAECLVRLGELELESTNPDALPAAAAWLEEALGMTDDPGLRERLAELYRQAGSQWDVVRVLGDGLDDLPPQEAGLRRVELARALEVVGDREGAAATLWSAWEAAPGTPGLGDALETVLADLDRVEELVQLLAERAERETDPGRIAALASRCGLLLLDELGRPQQAADLLRPQVSPEREGAAEALYTRALEAAGDRAELERWLAACSRNLEGPGRVEVLLQLARLQEETGATDDAIASLWRAERAAPRAGRDEIRRRILCLLDAHGELEAQADLLARLLEEAEYGEPRTTLRLERARLLCAGDRLEEACTELERARTEGPFPPSALRSLADLYRSQGRARDQVRVLREFLGTQPASDERRTSTLDLARALTEGPTELQDPDAAEQLMRGLLLVDPDDPEPMHRLVTLFEAAGRTDALKSILAERLEMGDCTVEEQRSLALRLATLESPSDSTRLLKRAREEHGPHAAIDRALADAYRACGDNASEARLARSSARVAPAGSPERREWVRRWARALETAGAPPGELLEQVEELLHESPDEPALLRTRLEMLRRTGPERALAEALENALASTETLPGPDRRRAVRELVLLREGPLDDLRGALERLRMELPDDPSLAPLAARLVSRLPDPGRELDLLRTLVLDPPEGFRPRPEHVRTLALALCRAGQREEAEPLLHRAVAALPQDLPTVRALDALARQRGGVPDRLHWLEVRFALEARERRLSLVREALTLAETAGRPDEALRWLRRWQALERPPQPLCFRWLELEQEHGDRPGEIRALRVARSQSESPRLTHRLVARQAELFEASGERELARRTWREAVEADPDEDPELLRALESSLQDHVHAVERAAVLRRLARHPSVPEEERADYATARCDLLAGMPDRRADAARELQKLFDGELGPLPERRVSWGTSLLELHAAIGDDRAWCEAARQLALLLPHEDRIELLRELACRLSRSLAARQRSIECWNEVLSMDPSDAVALRGLAELLNVPGQESRRADTLARLGGVGVEDAGDCFLESAVIRWTVLGDASGALDSLERCLAAEPTNARGHELRLELCAHLDRPEQEAESLQALLNLEGDGPTAAARWLRIAELLAGRDNRRVQVRRATERALALAPGDVAPARAVRKILERAHDWDRVVELLRKEVIDSPVDEAPGLLQRLARIEWFNRRDARAACEAIEELAQVEALVFEDLELYADVLGSVGRWRESLSVRAEALELRAETRPDAWLELARAQLERLDDPIGAHAACEAALSFDPGCTEALRLVADLDARLGNARSELAHRKALASQLSEGAEGAHELARAATVAREALGDIEEARVLFTRALERDGSCLSALLGSGELAFERHDWEAAEHRLAKTYPLLQGTPLASRRGEVARVAAMAAAELGQDWQVLEHVEVALEENPDDPEALELCASMALNVGAWQKAADALEKRLADDDGQPLERAKWLVQLARAHQELGRLDSAALALEETLVLRPDREAIRSRLVDLLESQGEIPRAIGQLDAWIPYATADTRPGLALRAATLALRSGDVADARDRLQGIVADQPGEAGAWQELAALSLTLDGPEAALRCVADGLHNVAPTPDRAPLLAIRAEGLSALGRRAESAEAALHAVELDPGHAAGAHWLAKEIGHVTEWRRAVRGLERTLDAAHLSPALEAQILDALGRTYAGPLQNMSRAERAYRRALKVNPENERAREAIAELTSFEPRAHQESLQLHKELLDRFPARRGSWRALERIADHTKTNGAGSACRWVLRALDGEDEAEVMTPDARALLDELSPGPEVERVVELAADDEADGIEAAWERRPAPGNDTPVQEAVRSLAGAAWELEDDTLARLIQESPGGRGIRKGWRILSGPKRDRAGIREVTPSLFRAEILGVATARAIGRQHSTLRAALEALLHEWPATTELDLTGRGDLGEAIQLCPPARSLLLRIAAQVRVDAG
ncbi:MAG: tetratricopeptide repeat protein [Myxococcota bacterium]